MSDWSRDDGGIISMTDRFFVQNHRLASCMCSKFYFLTEASPNDYIYTGELRAFRV